jgi:hypothetical protein
MANKPEFVDLISAATRQKYRRAMPRAANAPAEKEERRLSNWPPDHMQQWRLVNLTPWKIKLRSWKFKDWV